MYENCIKSKKSFGISAHMNTYIMYSDLVMSGYCIKNIFTVTPGPEAILCCVTEPRACPAEGVKKKTLSQQHLSYLQKKHKTINMAGQS